MHSVFVVTLGCASCCSSPPNDVFVRFVFLRAAHVLTAFLAAHVLTAFLAVAAGTELRDASNIPIGRIDCVETTGYAPDEASGIVVACKNRVIVVDALCV